MNIDEQRLQSVVEKVLEKLALDKKQGLPASVAPTVVSKTYPMGKNGLFDDIDQAIKVAFDAQQRLAKAGLEVRNRAIAAIRKLVNEHAEDFAIRAVDETGMGRVSDKITKNKIAANNTPGTEILRPVAFSGDHGLTITERAPWGVIASITPTTNATETIVNNGIGMLAAGNAVVFNLHPRAKRVGAYAIRMLNQAIVEAGGPDNCLCALTEPTIASAQAVMKHTGINLIVVTGGPAVVKTAMNMGKKCIAAGPGNPPVVVDETADIKKAARHIIDGASLDNNIVCIVEKVIIAVDSIADELKRELVRQGAYPIRENLVPRVTKQVINGSEANKDWVGKNVNVILKPHGLSLSDDVRLAFAEVDEDHPLTQVEQLMPVLPFVRARNWEEAIAMAVRVEHGFHHTAVMHSMNVEHMHTFARAANTSIFVKNGPSYSGLGLGGSGYGSWTIASPTGEGLTTAVHFSRERRCTLKDYFRIV